MIVILLLVVLNSFLLSFTIGYLAYLLLPYFGIPMSFTTIGIISVSLVTVLTILAITPVGDVLLKLPLAIRKSTERERKRLDPLLSSLSENIQKKLHRSISCRLYITDVAHPCIHTIGRNTLLLPRYLLEKLDDAALTAGLAAAMGRFCHRSAIYYSMTLGASLFGIIIQHGLQWFARTITKIGYRYVWLLPIGFIGSLLSYILRGLQLAITLCIKVNIRHRIYASDHVSKTLEMDKTFIVYLETLAKYEVRKDGFLQKFQEQFPTAMQRIDRLEQK